MKKLVSLLLVAVMLCTALAMTACGQELYFGKEYVASDRQLDLLTKLNANSIDVAVMDSIMAGYYMSKDTTASASLQIVENLTLATEQYGIGCRKGSGMAKAINYALVALTKNGTVDALAEKYGIKSELCIDTSKDWSEEPSAAEMEDFNYIQGKGSFIVGYTIFAPIAYEENDVLIGFDIELAKAVAAFLDLEVTFQEIDWNAKESLLNAKSIDCIWNGMTITEEREANMAMSIPYLNNKQVAVIRKADAQKYTTLESMAEAIVSAEAGSAGESCVLKED